MLEEAKEAGIPVILSDRTVEVGDESLYSCWVGSNFCEEGIKAGEWLENYLKEQGREDETIHLVTLQGTSGSSAQIGRSDGFEKILKKHSDWVMLEKQSGDFTQAKGQEVMEDFLEKYDDIEMGTDGDVIVISFDAVKDALTVMQDEKIMADFECNPLTAPLVEQTIRHMENGEEVDKVQYVEEGYFDYTMDLKSILKDRSY